MKILWNIIGVILILIGGLWFLQGLSLLPGTFMVGQTQWAVYGGIAILVGVGLLIYVNRRKSAGSGK